MPPNTAAGANYTVQLVDDSGLSADQRAAAELRFRIALEFALGGPAYVLPSLQAYMLAQALNEPSDDDMADDPGGAVDNATDEVKEDEEDHDSNDGGTLQMIRLWEKAESDAVQAALKPLGKLMAEARFEIVPLTT